MLFVRAIIALCVLVALAAPQAHADDPFYKGKRLILIINFAAGGPSDIEGRLLAKHLVKHIDGAPSIVVQNKDGAGGLIGATYLGELGPKDGSMFGYFTAAAWTYATDPSAYRVDLKSYEFIGSQPGNSVYYVRADTEPGIKDAADVMKARGLVAGGLSADASKDILIRLALDMLGLPHRYVTGYRSNSSARLALQQNEINFFSETTPAYFSVVNPSMTEKGLVVPVWYDPNYDGETLQRAQGDGRLGGAAVPGILPQGQGRVAERGAVGRLPHQPRGRFRDAAVDRHAAGLAAGRGRRAARRARASQQRQGLRRGGDEDHPVRAAVRDRSGHQRSHPQAARGQARGPALRRRLHQEREAMSVIPCGKLRSHVSRATGARPLGRADGDPGPSARLVANSWRASSARLHTRGPWVPGLAALARDTRVYRLLLARAGSFHHRRTSAAHADDPFYKNKRLTILINFAPGGPTDIEGRLFAKHLARHIDGAPNVIDPEHGRRRRHRRRQVSG